MRLHLEADPPGHEDNTTLKRTMGLQTFHQALRSVVVTRPGGKSDGVVYFQPCRPSGGVPVSHA